MKLYRSTIDLTRWFAFAPATGWVTFPAEIDGWRKRRSISGVNRLVMCEVPIRMGFNTGIPGAPVSASTAHSEAEFREAA